MKAITTVFIVLCTISITKAQQWYGNNNTTDAIARTGSVGIGAATTPIYGKLQVNQSSDASDQGIAVVNSTGGRSVRLFTDHYNSYLYSGATGQASLILNTTGYVGIGTSTPDKTLTVDGELGFFRNGASPNAMSVGFINYDNGFTIGNRSGGDPLRFQTNSTDRMFIRNDGLVGIGTSEPDNILTIDGNLGFFRNGASPTNSSTGFIKYTDGFIFGNASTSDPLRFQTNSADRLFIRNDGLIGVGTSDPDKTLTIDGELGFFRNGTSPTASSTGFIKYTEGFVIGNNSGGDPLRFQTNSVDRLFIQNDGNVGIGTGSKPLDDKSC